jgi:hypothetical protein
MEILHARERQQVVEIFAAGEPGHGVPCPYNVLAWLFQFGIAATTARPPRKQEDP